MYNLAMKLVIQIPCFNEEANIQSVLEEIPKKIKGIKEIKVIVLDDGSTDKTSEIAKKYNVETIKSNYNVGLSNTFKTGVTKALEENADILVNIDGDNQYCAKDIEKLIKPILENTCDIVIGTRPINKIKTFSPFKKILQKFGSFIVKLISKTDIKDAASGFRAFSKKALLNINVFNSFTYTIETIIQAKNKNLLIKNVDIDVNIQKNRKSKLFKNNYDYIFKQAKTLIRFFIIYRPVKFFTTLANIFLFFGIILALRYLHFYISNDGSGHIQSLILCAITTILSFILYMIAILGDLFTINRKLLEDIQYELRVNKYKK